VSCLRETARPDTIVKVERSHDRFAVIVIAFTGLVFTMPLRCSAQIHEAPAGAAEPYANKPIPDAAPRLDLSPFNQAVPCAVLLNFDSPIPKASQAPSAAGKPMTFKE